MISPHSRIFAKLQSSYWSYKCSMIKKSITMMKLYKLTLDKFDRRKDTQYKFRESVNLIFSGEMWKSIKAQESLRALQKNALNLCQEIGIKLSPSSFCLCFCQQKLLQSQRKKAANGIWFGPVALAMAKWFSSYWQKLYHYQILLVISVSAKVIRSKK